MQKIHNIVKVKPCAGEIGIEVEVEGKNIKRDTDGDKYWRSENDPSLKAPESREYVLKKPIKLGEVSGAVDWLYGKYLRGGEGVLNSVRAGVHVHINVQQFNTTELATALTAFYLLEPLLTTFCGKGRQGNLFCLRLMDAEYPIILLDAVYKDKRLRDLGVDRIRYASVNLKAVAQYGSLEFRSLQTPKDPNIIKCWVDMLYHVVHTAVKTFQSPKEVIESVSALGPRGFAELLIGKHNFSKLRKSNLEETVYEMVDLVQMFAYSHNWDLKASPSLNVFGTQTEEDW